MNLLFGKRNSLEVVIFHKYMENCGILRITIRLDRTSKLNVNFKGKKRIMIWLANRNSVDKNEEIRK